MRTLSEYLAELDDPACDAGRAAWYPRLRETVAQGEALWREAAPDRRARLSVAFRERIRTEELKAWYGEPESSGSLFQGTSVTSLTIPYEVSEPMRLRGMDALEDAVADAYIALHDRLEPAVRAAILEPVDRWMAEGVFYGVAVGSKMLSQALGLHARQSDVVFEVDGVTVDPHEITGYPQEIRHRYFTACLERVAALRGLGLTQAEFETSLVLADISKPKIAEYRDRLLLGPVRCNELATLLSRHVTARIRERTHGRIAPRSLMVTIYDTDTPYGYHQVAGYYGEALAPTLPGLTVLGASGSIDAFRWLYAYRVSLIAQKMMKSSLYSEVKRCFIPFVFYGVLVERDAEILLDLDHLGDLRYRGNLSPYLEFTYLLPRLQRALSEAPPFDAAAETASRLR